MKTLKKYWKAILTLLFIIAIFWFWGMPYKSVLSYQEQYQLFLFDNDYFFSHIVLPGGFASYIAEFITQFYYYPLIGAVELTLLYILIQQLTWIILRQNGTGEIMYPISFVLPLLLWFVMGDENVMLCFVVSLIATLFSMYGYNIVRAYTKRLLIRCLILLLWIPFSYWLFGAFVFAFVLYVILIEIKGECLKRCVLFSLFLISYIVIIELISSLFLQYPLSRLLEGINYYRYPTMVPVLLPIVMFVAAMLPIIVSFKINVKKPFTYIVTECLVLLVLGVFSIKCNYDNLKYDLIDYDYLVRTAQWDEIIKKEEAKPAKTPMGVACVNFALSQTGQMGNRLFEFYQNGKEGLLPPFEGDFTSPLSTSDIYFKLGAVNTSQQYIFEAQEAIPNFNKSGRCIKRLVETNLVNGNYVVASKYLRILKKTMFYRDWAEKTFALLSDKAVNEHVIYGKLRKLQITHDFLFNNDNTEYLLGQLETQNPNNKMAYDYLISWYLLDRKLDKFIKVFPLGKYAGLDYISIYYQQALLYFWTQHRDKFNGIPNGIDKDVARDIIEFANILTSEGPSSSNLSQYSKTYWYYLLVKNNQNEI